MSGITPRCFATAFVADNDAKMIKQDPEVSARLIEYLELAKQYAYLIMNYPAEDYYVEPPAGSTLIEIHGAVRRGFALLCGDEVWIGYSEAGNGTPGFVWKSTFEEFRRIAEFAPFAR